LTLSTQTDRNGDVITSLAKAFVDDRGYSMLSVWDAVARAKHSGTFSTRSSLDRTKDKLIIKIKWFSFYWHFYLF